MTSTRKTLLTGLAMAGVLGATAVHAPMSALAAKPSIDNESVSGVTQTSAIWNATINPGKEEAHYHFEYGLSTAYGASVPVPDVNVGSGSSDVVVGQPISALQPGTTYHYVVVATNKTGTAEGEDQTFTTRQPLSPTVATGAVSGLTQNGAILSGTIDARGVQTAYEFDLGSDTGYGTRIFGDAGSSDGPQTATLTLQDLAAATTYHYRLLAVNTYATTYGSDQTFTTLAFPSSLLSAPAAPVLVPASLIASATATAAAKPVAHATQHKKSIKKGKKHKKNGGRSSMIGSWHPGRRAK
jgi:hypothetical protein